MFTLIIFGLSFGVICGTLWVTWRRASLAAQLLNVQDQFNLEVTKQLESIGAIERAIVKSVEQMARDHLMTAETIKDVCEAVVILQQKAEEAAKFQHMLRLVRAEVVQ